MTEAMRSGLTKTYSFCRKEVTGDLHKRTSVERGDQKSDGTVQQQLRDMEPDLPGRSLSPGNWKGRGGEGLSRSW